MAAIGVIKKSLQTMEQKCADYKTMLENRVRSLNEMKRKQSEAETDEERRELKIAIDSLENIIATDKTTLFDMDTACKDLREEFNKAEEGKEEGGSLGLEGPQAKKWKGTESGTPARRNHLQTVF